MTSSLVGSEMCIRDRRFAVPHGAGARGRGGGRPARLHAPFDARGAGQAVSYTHLTLPTICSV
eukprot:2354322-Prorocentrum_lima.AAC.1